MNQVRLGPSAAVRARSDVRAAAFWAFWILLVYGFVVGELTLKRVVVFLVLWIVGRITLAYIPWQPASAMFSPYTAILDVALVFAIFKGDVRLT